ncbi:MAG: toll/interleukin-1 receptor domain-containing protein [Lachnospiraceae bacterium]|nr:toll/interleukin-1 receptor domain-containing protein [Lachnospiraceae bacterium]
MKYNAFISYRHAPLDMEIAKKIHSGLETYHVPKAVQKKTGKKKIQRVFRDQEELPIGSDLNDNIAGALAQSEFLIVICSPRTPESYWVCKEIESFIEMHDREHVLAVLIEGEPDESFPPMLLTDENGNPVEPLAADVRGADKKERNRKFKTEILRLAAPVLGCSYDDLKQRHRERIIRRTISMVAGGGAVVALAGTAFGIYNATVARQMEKLAHEKSELADEKTLLAAEMYDLAQEKTRLAEEVLQEYNEKQINQSRFYAERSLALLKAGNREDAALVAIAGLPSEENDRPYVGDAEYALSKSLYAYSTEGNFGFDRVLSHDMQLNDVKVSGDRKYLITTDNGFNIYIWDSEKWTLKTKMPAEIGDDNRIIEPECIDCDDTGIYVSTEDEIKKYSYDGEVLYTYADPYGESIDYCEFNVKTMTGAYVSKVSLESGDVFEAVANIFAEKEYVINLIDLKDGKLIKTVQNPIDIRFDNKAVFSRDGSKLAITHSENNKGCYLSVLDIESSEIKTIALTEEYAPMVYATTSGNFAVITAKSVMSVGGNPNVSLDLVSPEGKILWRRSLDTFNEVYWNESIRLKEQGHTSEQGTNHNVVITDGPYALTFDEKSGELISSITLPESVWALALYENSTEGLVGLKDGQLLTVDFGTGEFGNESFDTGKSIKDIVSTGKDLIVKEYGSSDAYVLKRHFAPDLEKIAESDMGQTVVGVSPGGKYILARCYNEGCYHFYAPDGKIIYTFDSMESIIPKVMRIYDDRILYLESTVLLDVDPYKGEVKKHDFSDLQDFLTVSSGYFTANGKYCAVWGYGYVAVYDTGSGEYVYFNNHLEETGGRQIGNVCVSEDGKNLYISATGTNLYRVDIESGEITVYENDDLRENSETYGSRYLIVSPDGKTVAMGCLDGRVRIIDASTGSIIDEFPLPAMYNIFLQYTDDGRKLIVQGDEYTVKVRDIENGVFLSSYNLEGKISYIAEDTDRGLTALSGTMRTALLENGMYGVVADCESSYGVTYCAENGSFVLSGKNNIYRIAYKNYEELKILADKEFSGAVLSDEKKKIYNID